MILANGPAVARLCGHTRKWAHAGIQSGWFGPVTEHKGILYVALDRVEARMSLSFSESQINVATENHGRAQSPKGGHPWPSPQRKSPSLTPKPCLRKPTPLLPTSIASLPNSTRNGWTSSRLRRLRGKSHLQPHARTPNAESR